MRFADLGLSEARVVIDDPRDRTGTLAELAMHGRRIGLLFPSKDARPLASLAPDERPDGLIVLDGTWSQARTLYRQHTWLHALPHYSVTPPAPSLYRIRAEPFEQAVSTIEAIVLALEALEPELGRQPSELLGAFVRMIDVQIELGKQQVGRLRKRRPKLASRAVPDDFRAFDRLILVFGELAPAGPPGTPRVLLSWTALRLADGATFEQFFAPTEPVSDRHLGHMGVTRDDVERGLSVSAIREAWGAFVRPGDVLAAWNQSTINAYREIFAREDPAVLVKGIYSNVKKTGLITGPLAEVMAREGLEPEDTPFRGRARVMMGRLAAITRRLSE